jgi:hypothetical protein
LASADFCAVLRLRARPGFLFPFALRRFAMMNPRVRFLHKSYSKLQFAASDRAWTRACAIARPDRRVESCAFFDKFGMRQF